MDPKLEDLKTRFWTSSTIVVGLGLCVFYIDSLVVKLVLSLVFTVFLILTQWEFFYMTSQKGAKGLRSTYLAAPSIIGATLLACFNPVWHFVINIMVGGLIFLFFIEHFFYKKNPIANISISIMSLMYIVLPLSFLLRLTFAAPEAALPGKWWVALLVLVTKAGDVGAYFTGKTIGRNYLAPKISPKKTYEGLLGGLIASIGMSFAVIYVTPEARTLLCAPWAYALIFGTVLSLLGFIGDLAESLLKRDAKVKDSNKLKGFGGFLDMFDSLIFTAPAFYLFLIYGKFL